MGPSATKPSAQTGIEDILAQLPITSVTDYSKGQVIYGPGKPSTCIYLLVVGKVEISQIAEDGSKLLLDIVRPEEVFGESAFLDGAGPSEQASAIGPVRLMTWAISDIEDLVTKRPRLAVALLQILAQRNADLTRRIESFALDTIERRLARSLLRFSDRLGTQEDDGTVRMMPFTHQMLSQYVGTSREVVTDYMNRFRRRGYVSYSRQSILLNRDTLKSMIDSSASTTPATLQVSSSSGGD